MAVPAAKLRSVPCQAIRTQNALSLPACFWIRAASATVSAALKLEDFAGEVNRIIYAAMLRLHATAKPIERHATGRRAARSQTLQRGGWRFGGNAGRAVSAGAVGSRTAAVPFPCFGNLPPTLFAGIAFRNSVDGLCHPRLPDTMSNRSVIHN